MHVACRCGQQFTIHAEVFPHRVSCHACGRHFNVLDDGVAVDADNFAAPIHAPAAPTTTAIQVALLLADSPQSTAITADEVSSPVGASAISEDSKRNAEIEAIDLLWKLEREGFNLLPFSGIEIMPSISLASSIPVIFGTACAVLWVLLAAAGFPFEFLQSVCVGMLTAPIWAILPMHIYKQAREFHVAEAAWQNKRLAIIKQSYANR